MKRLLLVILIMSVLPLSLFAQKEVRSQVRKGNSLFEKERYTEAEIEYRKALELNPSDPEGNYNLANTLYRTKRNEEAGKIYQELLKEIKLMSKEQAADLAHNAGNLAMKEKKYEEAIELYKESLRRRPTDEETRYNLALAQKLLEKEKQESGGGENQQQQNQQQQQDDQQKDQQQQQQQQEQSDKENKEQQQQAQSQRMSQDNAEKILEAFIQDEKDTQRKVEQMKQQQQQGRKSRPKNW